MPTTPGRKKKGAATRGPRRTTARSPRNNATRSARPRVTSRTAGKLVKGKRGSWRTLRAGGLGVTVSVAEGANGAWDERRETCEVAAVGITGLKTSEVARLRRGILRTVPALAALGHSQRARMMVKLLEGPATYRTLQRLTKMKAGPLYYHINELRSAGLVMPKQRDLYELTRGGRNLTLVAAVADVLVRDRRRRPGGEGT